MNKIVEWLDTPIKRGVVAVVAVLLLPLSLALLAAYLLYEVYCDMRNKH